MLKIGNILYCSFYKVYYVDSEMGKNLWYWIEAFQYQFLKWLVTICLLKTVHQRIKYHVKTNNNKTCEVNLKLHRAKQKHSQESTGRSNGQKKTDNVHRMAITYTSLSIREHWSAINLRNKIIWRENKQIVIRNSSGLKLAKDNITERQHIIQHNVILTWCKIQPLPDYYRTVIINKMMHLNTKCAFMNI